MEMPFDPKKFLAEVSQVNEARALPLSVSVYFDETAPGDLQAYARQAFASASPQARVSLMYLDGRPFTPFEGDDISVIVAGSSPSIGSYAQKLRDAGVPVMVLATAPKQVLAQAKAAGFPLPEADVLSPAAAPKTSKAAVLAKGARGVSGAAENLKQQRGEGRLAGVAGVVQGISSTAADYLDAFAEEPANPYAATAGAATATTANATSAAVGAGSKVDVAAGASAATDANSATAVEPIALTPRIAEMLSERMGRWVVETCKEKRLAFAVAFPFVRKPLANDAIVATSIQNGGVGALVIIPGADMPLMTLNQMKMLLQIAAAYGEDLGPARLKELAAVVGGGFACRSVARNVLSVVPVGGWAVKAGIGYTGTVAMGKAAIEYFEGGATLSNFTKAGAKVRDTVLRVTAEKAAKSARDKGVQTLQNMRSAVVGFAGSAVPFAGKAASQTAASATTAAAHASAAASTTKE